MHKKRRVKLKLREEIRVASAQGRISGIIIGLLPAVMMVFLMIVNPEYFMGFADHPIGRVLLVVSALLGERCGVEDLNTVTGALVQAGQLGIPICNVLQSQAAAIRRSRRSKVKEKAATVSTRMLPPTKVHLIN